MKTRSDRSVQGSARRSGLARRSLRWGLGGASLCLFGGVTTVGCLDRPVSELTPNTSNLFVDQIVQTAVDKIDLLFMIDNSASMADKQQVLRDAVPDLVSRLVNPFCTDGSQPATPDADCPTGSEREFNPISDFHLGVITSSLGDAGANVVGGCTMGTSPGDDRGRLLGSIRSGLAGEAAGFLAWRADTSGLINDFQAHVAGAGETGCGYEASLESWYRFLIDPNPPAELIRVKCRDTDAQENCVGFRRDENNQVILDTVLLEQRAEFLRPDSLLAVIMLTDENDCSIQRGGSNWLAAAPNSLRFKASAACEADSNSPCCYACASRSSAPDGCNDYATECGGPGPQGGDQANLRCWDQKRRAGIDFLYPIDRYVEGLKSPQVTVGYDGCTPVKAPNPLYLDLKNEGRPVRDPSLVFFAGIVGVPWQDVATTQDTCDRNPDACPPADGSLKYLTAPQLTSLNRWQTILGTPVPPTADQQRCERSVAAIRHNFRDPEDPFMEETAFERSGQNPITGDPLPGSPSAPNGLNGYDYNSAIGDAPGGERTDLQYACTFPLSGNPCATGGDCDCENPTDMDKPLCSGIGVQTHAKAYPGTRLLSALNGFGENSIVASICPKTMDPGAADYGYRPAVTAIIDRLKEALSGRCLPRQLAPDENRLVQCKVIEAAPQAGLDCGRAGRGEPTAAVVDAVKSELRKSERCGGNSGVDCDSLTYCEILQAGDPTTGGTSAQLEECLDQEVTSNVTGWCYIDANQGNELLIEKCKATERQLLRFVGNDTPVKGATTFIACRGASLDDSFEVTQAD